MNPKFASGDTVQTPFGKGLVREVRNSGRLLVDVHGRALIVAEREVSAADPTFTKPGRTRGPSETRLNDSRPAREHRGPSKEVDLHGLVVEEALDRAERALIEALLSDFSELRLIHGRSGGRIRAALHRRLREIPSVRAFGLDPRNQGVTIVSL